MKSFLRLCALTAILFPLLAASDGWVSIGPWGGPAGAVSIDHRNPDRVLAASRNGNLFLSEDAGQSWKRLPFPRIEAGFIETVKIHPASGLFLVGASDERGETGGLYLSANQGAEWTLAPATKGVSVFALASFPGDQNVWAAGTRSGVLVSRDGGRQWEPAAPGPFPVMSVAFDSKDSSTIYAGTTHLPWKTTDGGKTWRSIHEGMLDDSDVFSIHVDSQFPERVYASACSGIYRSTGRGELWKKAQGIPGTDRRTHVVTEDPFYSRLIYAGTTAGLWKSADAGETWRKLNEANVRSLEFHPRDGRVAYMATDRGLMKSTTAATSFAEVNSGFSGRPVLRVEALGSELVALVLETNGQAMIERSLDGGRTWSREGARDAATVSLPGRIDDIAEFGGRLWARAGGRLFRRDAKSWKQAALPGAAAVSALATANALWAVTSAGIYRSADGEAWKSDSPESRKLDSPKDPQWSRIEQIEAAGDAAAVRRGSDLWLRAADRWVSCGKAPGRLLTFLPDPVRAGALLAGTDSGLWRWQAGRWSPIEGGLFPGFISSIAIRPGQPSHWYAAQAGRLFYSTDAGARWKLAGGAEQEGGQPLPPGSELDGNIERLEAAPGGVIAVVHGRGAYFRQHLQ